MPRLDVKKQRDLPSSVPPRASPSLLLPRLWHLSPGRGLRGALQGSGLFWSCLEGRSDASRSQMSSSFVFRNCLISPSACPPSPGGKMPLYMQWTGCKNQRREGWKESAVWDSEGWDGQALHARPAFCWTWKMGLLAVAFISVNTAAFSFQISY